MLNQPTAVPPLRGVTPQSPSQIHAYLKTLALVLEHHAKNEKPILLSQIRLLAQDLAALASQIDPATLAVPLTADDRRKDRIMQYAAQKEQRRLQTELLRAHHYFKACRQGRAVWRVIAAVGWTLFVALAYHTYH